ncbi:MAG: UDP-N-acetylglucosamine--N-acetylmuramyl-(pentapeptide) pyrophosphoryl-undecaprenol N-acetylglucosamine transferase, partial [Clostridia bacterium]|nr:UDP-N-acetylglucosamine--N-acetylmuramyl-(pentapeptide) pyrophosphoryl-undecaprenol N-acetylglucosamine transferase [Clostridia bacterium]
HQHFPRKTKITLTGLPVRPEIMAAERLPGLKALGLSPDKLTVVITGGSRGARSINRVMTEILPNFSQQNDVQFCHVTGQAGYWETIDTLKKSGISMGNCGNIKIVPYLYEMHHALAAADIIIGRAGASFLSEVMVRGIPAILIPFPFATANHQEHNARALERRGAAKVILEKDLTAKILEDTLQTFIQNSSMRRQVSESAKGLGKTHALRDILDIVAGISKER